MHGTKPVGGYGISAGAGGTDLTPYPHTRDLAGSRCREASQPRGDLLREDAPQTRESGMVAVAASFMIVDQCLIV